VVIGSARFDVRGDSWMDHEWSTGALEPDQVGWDWLGLTLADGRDLMFFRLRRRDGTIDPSSSGTLVAADGSVERLAAADVQWTTLSSWQSPRTGASYPVTSHLVSTRARLDVVVRPLVPDQELDLSFRYWEGAVAAAAPDGAPAGSGYLELTGYDRKGEP
jgi:predicted secreted hydrolase